MQLVKQKALLATILLVLALIGVSATAYYYYNQYQKALSKPGVESSDEVKKLKDAVSKLMTLPNEDPVVATVTDKSKLEGQVFFRYSENGDKVLIFKDDGRAVLYRPSTAKIIDVTTFTSLPEGGTSEDTTPLTIAIYNGTTQSGLAANLEKKITENVQYVSVTDKTAATKTNYTKTVVVDVSGKNGARAKSIADLFGVDVTELPAGEKKPETDILVIAGTDNAQ